MPTFPGSGTTNCDCSLENMFPACLNVCTWFLPPDTCMHAASYPYPPFPVLKRIKGAYQSLVQLEAKLLDYLIPGATPRGIVAKTVAVSQAMVAQFEYSFLPIC